MINRILTLKKDHVSINFIRSYMAFKKMGLVLLNLGLALLNGFMSYKNNKHENYKQSLFNAFACGFCICAANAIFLYDL